MSVTAGIEAILRANEMSFPLTLAVRTLSCETGEFHSRTVVAQSLQEVVDIAEGGDGARITCNGVVLFPPGMAVAPARFRLHLPDTLKGALDQ